MVEDSLKAVFALQTKKVCINTLLYPSTLLLNTYNLLKKVFGMFFFYVIFYPPIEEKHCAHFNYILRSFHCVFFTSGDYINIFVLSQRAEITK